MGPQHGREVPSQPLDGHQGGLLPARWAEWQQAEGASRHLTSSWSARSSSEACKSSDSPAAQSWWPAAPSAGLRQSTDSPAGLCRCCCCSDCCSSAGLAPAASRETAAVASVSAAAAAASFSAAWTCCCCFLLLNRRPSRPRPPDFLRLRGADARAGETSTGAGAGPLARSAAVNASTVRPPPLTA